MVFSLFGIDITIGSENSYGGILIRSIGKIKPTGQFDCICGPLRVKNELLKNFGSINDNARFPYFENKSNIFSYDESKDYKKTTRIGIDKKKDNYDKEFRYVLFEGNFPKNYRPIKSKFPVI